MRIAICDDDENTCEELKKILLLWEKNRIYRNSITVCTSAEDLLQCIDERGRFDLILLDIEMYKVSGMDAAKEIRERDYITQIIFITSHIEYSMEAFAVRPFQFLKKPVQRECLLSTLDEFEKVYSQAIKCYSFKYNGIHYNIPFREIYYIQYDVRRIFIQTKDNIYKQYNIKMDEVEKIIEEKHINMIRVHKSFIVNPHYICKLQKKDIIMIDESWIPIGRKHQEFVKKQIMKKVLEREEEKK